MANYIPVLAGPVFLSGLAVFGVGAALLVLRSLWLAPRVGIAFDGAGALRFGLNASVVATAVALLAFAWSFAALPTTLEGKAYYEIAFWGGGHALQFTWTLLMLVAWLWLASASGAPVRLSPRIALLMFVLALAAVFVTPYAYLAHDIASVEHRNLLTWAMRFGGGPAIVPIGLAVALALSSAPAPDAAARPLRAAPTTKVWRWDAMSVRERRTGSSRKRWVRAASAKESATATSTYDQGAPPAPGSGSSTATGASAAAATRSGQCQRYQP